MTSPQSYAMMDNGTKGINGQVEILTPHNHDVLSGRGNFVNNHEGNKRFRALVNKYKQECVACPKSEKLKYAELIVNNLRSLNPPGRFLKKDEGTGLWYDIGEKKTFDKTRQALREGAPKIRLNLGGNNNPIETPTVVISAILSNSNEKSSAVTELTSNGLPTTAEEIASSTTKTNSGDFLVGGGYDSDDYLIDTEHPAVRRYSLEKTDTYPSSMTLPDHRESMENISIDPNATECIAFERSTRNLIHPSRERFLSDATFSISDLKRNWSDGDLSRLEELILLDTSIFEEHVLEREQSSVKSKSTASSRRNMFAGSTGSNKSECLMMDDCNQSLQSCTRGASSFLDMMSLEDVDEYGSSHQFVSRLETGRNDDDNLKKSANRTRSHSLVDISVSSSFMKSGRSGNNLFFSFSKNMDNIGNA